MSTKLTRVALVDVSASLGGLQIKDGNGAFILTAGGVAGTFSGTIAAAAGGFDANVSVAVRINQTTSPVDETMEIGGRTINVRFSPTEIATTAGGPFLQFSGSGTIKLGDFVEIRGTFSFGASEVHAHDVTVFLGQGPAFLEDGSINPDARGVYITDAEFYAIETGGGRAFSAVGTVQVVGIPGVTLSGTVRVKFNTTGAAQFASARRLRGRIRNGPRFRRSPSPATSRSTCSGWSSSGPIAFTRNASGNLVVTLGGTAPVRLALGPLEINIPSASFEVSPAGLVASLTVTLAKSGTDGADDDAGRRRSPPHPGTSRRPTSARTSRSAASRT